MHLMTINFIELGKYIKYASCLSMLPQHNVDYTTIEKLGVFTYEFLKEINVIVCELYSNNELNGEIIPSIKPVCDVMVELNGLNVETVEEDHEPAT